MTIAPDETGQRSGADGSGAVEGAWARACPIDDLTVGRGVAVLGPRGEQAALFRLPAAETDREAAPGRSRLYAIGNIDPFGRAAVLSRGLTGDRAGEPTVASPLGKQVFALRTGVCLDDESVSVPSYGVRVVERIVEVFFPA
ncbi:nitrite reductase (NAD(P)H) small subunit [Gordonia rubripertincta]|uniref:Nitrite reductase (NAD(P)H) small subunit n=2 Tax=Gordonia rubripertincta TaxID=36822 RepID=A0AAW4G9F5_GORRU|nr:nitrite reductase (NAD(P)H) small subunit [Gordonia rubripertincta]MBM7279730.1 nitrite reductase (NAD(P)H) small subunit [Gordonia rubripertincta]MDG6783329.1 nitrite reductase (NAD(P)H) small subunit [Gordonia rubripertincta]NKY65556.1 nitrite reductase small subunit [Gordonia rubripertincta]QMU20787.1 nitrite reductase (NAD(P)H) small subunit [Gordonia rubripertincta]GAB84990.1 nitrite reductase small subunit [Gordonia rubripertincta NBRC 101908]